jgi:hypothetical protein
MGTTWAQTKIYSFKPKKGKGQLNKKVKQKFGGYIYAAPKSLILPELI